MIIFAFITSILLWICADIIRENVLGWKCKNFKEHMLHFLVVILILLSAVFSGAAWDEIKEGSVKEHVEQSK